MPEKFDFSRPEDQKKFEGLKPEEKDMIKDEAENEAFLMQERIKSGEAKNYNEAEKTVEAYEVPLKILGELEKDDFIRQQLESKAGVWERYSIKQHTLMAMTQFEKYFSKEPLPLNINTDSFRKILAVHDIGKPRALAEGDKYKQYEYSQVYAAEILKGLGLKEQEIKIGLSLISGDPIGQYLKTDNSGKCVKEIIKMAAMADVRPVDFLKILEIFYEADAAAYTKDATIKNVVKGEKALDFLFEFDQENKKIEFAPDVKNRMERLKTEIELVSSGKEAKGIEKELSPELIEKIMDKVEDVNKKGMAYHVLGAASSEVKSMGVLNVLKRDLQFGLLGNMGRVSPRKNLIEEYSKFKDQNPSFSEKNWAKSVRKFKPAPVFFNIVGRSEISLWNRRLYPYAKFEIANSTWVRSKEDKIVITFDLSKFKEVEDIELFKNPENLKTNTYYNDCPSVGSPGYANTEEGFILSSRVAPRFFKGIVFNLLSNEKNDKGENIRKDCTDPVMMQERADEIVSTMKEAYKNREDMLLPVYDVYGNLYWPKNMNYKEVKKFVAEKNKEKGLDSPDVIKQNIKETKRLNKGKRFIFDDDGNLLWPKKMSYEEVKQFVAERDKNKKNEKTT